MASQGTAVKISYNGTLRKVFLDLSSVQTMEKSVSENYQLPLGSFTLSYMDEDKDIISLPRSCSKSEFEEFKALRDPIRLIVTSLTESTEKETVPLAPAVVEEEEVKKPITWADVLANKELVQAVQQAIASPVITEFLVSIGQSLGEETGDKVFNVLINQGPLVHAVFNEILDKYPELKELFGDDIVESFVHKGMKSCRRAQRTCGGGWDLRNFCRNRQWCSEESKDVRPIHFGVMCDGCASNENLKEISVRDGFTAKEGGYIAGIRFKSTTIENYDLCESCEASGYFQTSHGPFLKIIHPVQSPFEVMFMRRHHGHRSHCHRPEPKASEPEKKVKTDASASSDAPKDETLDKLIQEGLKVFDSFIKSSVPNTQPKSGDDTVPEKWKSKIELLKTLGFVEWTRYIPILEQENGDLERTISRIISLQA